MRCFATVATFSHLGPVFALERSLKQSGNPEPLHVLIADAAAGELPAQSGSLVFHSLDEVRGVFPKLMPYYFDAFELCTALKTFFVSLLLGQTFESVVYLDNDIFPVGSFDPVWNDLNDKPIILTPHVLRPPALDLQFIDEVSIVDQGIFNGGFSAWSRSSAATAALRWLEQRLPIYGFVRRPQGMLADQKMLPFLPEYFPHDVLISRDERLNIAFWNLQERCVSVRDGRYFIDGDPVVFFHMSGYRRAHPELACSYMSPEINREMLEIAPWFREVMRDYDRLLAAAESGPGAQKKSYKFSRYRGFELNAPLRTILFKKGDLSWRDPQVWKVVIWERLRLVKRGICSWWN